MDNKEEDAAILLAAHFAMRPWDDMAEDRRDLREKFRNSEQPHVPFDINEPTKVDCRHAAIDMLDLLSKDGSNG